MNWYLAKVVFQIICGDGNHTAQFDEQLRLVGADSEYEAFTKAQQLGILEQETFLNEQKNLVQWKFIDVSELHKLSNLMDGAEMYSRVQEVDNAELYKNSSKKGRSDTGRQCSGLAQINLKPMVFPLNIEN